MIGKVIEIKDLGEFLVVECVSGGVRLLDMEKCKLSLWKFENENKMLDTLNIVGIRSYRGER